MTDLENIFKRNGGIWKRWKIFLIRVDENEKCGENVQMRQIKIFGNSGQNWKIWIFYLLLSTCAKIFFGQKWKIILKCPGRGHMPRRTDGNPGKFCIWGLQTSKMSWPDSTEMGAYGAYGRIWFSGYGSIWKNWKILAENFVRTGKIWKPAASGRPKFTIFGRKILAFEGKLLFLTNFSCKMLENEY